MNGSRDSIGMSVRLYRQLSTDCDLIELTYMSVNTGGGIADVSARQRLRKAAEKALWFEHCRARHPDSRAGREVR